jgi:hypothetical protein
MIEVGMDSLFLIGDSHKVCQDYALSGEGPEGVYYTIVSDGCSSSKNSDLGARILALMAKKHIHYLYGELTSERKYHNFGNIVIASARNLAQDLCIHPDSLDATLLISLYDNGRITTFIYGDGNIIIADKDGNTFVRNYKFESGAPFYLNYWNQSRRYESYKEQFGGTVIITQSSSDYTAIEKFNHPLYQISYVEDVSMIAITSDGIESFAYESTPVEVNIDINKFFAFKNINGEFLKRRVERQVSEYAKFHMVHHDDLGIAAMIFKEIPDEDYSQE